MSLTDARTPERWAAPPRRRLSAGTRHRLWALLGLVVVGGPAFVIGGRYWVNSLDLTDAVARFRAAGAKAAVAVSGLPEPGVYQYRTTGGEHVSFLDYHRTYSATTMRIVTRRGCGVREQQYFLVQHIEYYDRCGGTLAAYGTDIAFWWTHGTQTFRCPTPPAGSFDMAGHNPGDEVTWSCADPDTRAAQVTRYVGDETVEVAGVALPARHTEWITTFSGATRGTATVDDWFQPDTGLLLREHRDIGLQVGSVFVGKVGYVDSSTYTLESLTPTR